MIIPVICIVIVTTRCVVGILCNIFYVLVDRHLLPCIMQPHNICIATFSTRVAHSIRNSSDRRQESIFEKLLLLFVFFVAASQSLEGLGLKDIETITVGISHL